MDDLLFGMETELAICASQGGDAADDERQGALFELPPSLPRRVSDERLGRLVADLFLLAGEQLRTLPDPQSSGVYLENGSRIYPDAGLHPELCTPECRTPEELVRWQLAGERILTELGEGVMKRNPGVALTLFRCNVDYSGTQHTWGCHESYQHQSDAQPMSENLIPHLVTRILYTGSGGFNNCNEEVEFLLSPRVPHLLHDSGGNSQSERSLYHTKNEPLGSSAYNRLHLLCGESTCSQLATYLKFGTTALIVRMIDAGVCRGRALRFESPRVAMNAYARDPHCRAEVRLADGRCLTAVAVQREYLAMAEAQLDAEFMPDWAPLLCERWRRMLDQLESAPTSLSTTLDWAIKHELFASRMARARASGDPLVISAGLGAELCEIDVRFGELGPAGLFHQLDLARRLDHRLPELGSVEEAMSAPPRGGRAEVRGLAIRELSPGQDGSRYRCQWDEIVDRYEARSYDMRDPYGRNASWVQRSRRGEDELPNESARRRIDTRVQEGIALYQGARLSLACEMLERAAEDARAESESELEAIARFWWATAHHDAGRLRAAEQALAPILETVRADASHATACRVLTRHALVCIDHATESAQIEAAVERARSCIGAGDDRCGGSRVAMVEARWQGASGDYDRAVDTIQRAVEAQPSDSVSFARSSYLRWLVQFLRRSGQHDRASERVEGWRRSAGLFGARYDGNVMLACAESALARDLGHFGQALSHARVAVERAEGRGPNRYHTHACCTLIESAVAEGELELARPYVERLAGQMELEIGEQRCDARHAEAVYWRSAAARATPVGGNAARALERRAALAEEAAHAEAAQIDARLGTTHHVRELGAGFRPVG